MYHLDNNDDLEWNLFAIVQIENEYSTRYNFIRFQRAVLFLSTAITRIRNNWRASEASETLSGVYKFELVRYVYIY